MGASSVLGKAAEVLDCAVFSPGDSKFLWCSLGASCEKHLPRGNCIVTHWWLFWGQEAQGIRGGEAPSVKGHTGSACGASCAEERRPACQPPTLGCPHLAVVRTLACASQPIPFEKLKTN